MKKLVLIATSVLLATAALPVFADAASAATYCPTAQQVQSLQNKGNGEAVGNSRFNISFDPRYNDDGSSYDLTVTGIKGIDATDAGNKAKKLISTITAPTNVVAVERGFQCSYSVDWSSTGDEYNGVNGTIVSNVWSAALNNSVAVSALSSAISAIHR